MAYLARVYGVPAVDTANFEPSQELVDLVPFRVAADNRLVPLEERPGSLLIAMVDPSNIFAIDELHRRTGRNIDVAVASEESMAAALARWYGS